MKIEIKCTASINSANIHFDHTNKWSRIEFSANIHLNNNSDLTFRNPIIINMPLSPHLSEMISDELKRFALETLRDKGE